MSTVDNKVVRMKFDNAQFEQGVSKSMSTIDKLESKLKFKDAGKGISGLQSAFDKLDLTSISKGIANLENRFSTMGIAGMNIVNKITDATINAAKKLEQATIGQIKAGGWSRAMNLANAQFMVEGLKLDWDEMLKAINYGVQDTAYGLDAAAKAASSLAASGVDFKESVEGANDSLMHTSLRAISGVAAMTNSTYEDISRIFTSVAGNGRLMGDQLLQLSARGLNVAANLAQVMNTTEADIRDMVSKGKISFEMFATAMDDAFGAHAKEANKTFTGALSNMKAALSRIGAIFAQPVIDKTNTFFISITTKIKEFQKALSDTTDKDGNKVIRFAGHFAEAWQSAIDTLSFLIDKIDVNPFFKNIAEKLDSIAVKAKTFFDDVKFLFSDYNEESEKFVDNTGKTIAITEKEYEAAKKVIAGGFGYGSKRKNALEETFGKDSAKRIQDYVDQVAAAGYDYKKATIEIVKDNDGVSGSMAQMVKDEKMQRKIKFHAVMNQLSASMASLWRAAKNVFKAMTKVGTAIYNAFAKVFGLKGKVYGTTSAISYFLVKFANFTEKLIISDKAASKITTKFILFFSVVKKGLSWLLGVWNKVVSIMSGFIKTRKEISELPQAAQDAMIKSGVGGRIFGFFTTLPGFVTKAIALVKNAIETLKNLKIPFTDLKAGDIFAQASEFGSSLWETIKTSFGSVDWGNKISGLFNFIIDIFSNINFGDAAKIAGTAFVVSTLARLIFAIGSSGRAIDAIALIPQKIGFFIGNLSGVLYQTRWAIRRASVAYTLITIAKAVLIMGGTIVLLSNVEENALYRAVSVLIVIGLVLKALGNLMIGAGAIETGGIGRTIGALMAGFRSVYAMALLVAAIGAAVALISSGMALIHKSGASSDNGETLLAITTIFGLIGALIFELVKLTASGDIVKFSYGPELIGTLLSLSVVIVALGAAVLAISLGLSLLTKVPVEVLGTSILVLAIIFAGFGGVINTIRGVSPGALLSAAPLIVSIGFSISIALVALAGALSIISSSFTELNTIGTDIWLPMLTFVGIIGAIGLAVYALSKRADMLLNAAATVKTLFAMAVLVAALGYAVAKIVKSMSLFKGMTPESLGSMMTTMGLIIGSMVILIYTISSFNPDNLLAGAVLFIGLGLGIAAIAYAVVIMTGALGIMSAISISSVLALAGGIAMVLVGLGIAVAIAASGFKDYGPESGSAKNMILGILGFAASLYIIAAALKKIDGVSNLLDSVLALTAIVVAISVALGILTALAGSTFNSGDVMFSIGAAFILIAASLWVIADALSRLGDVDISAVAVLGGALLVMAVSIGVLSKIAPADKMVAVGKAFLYIGLGAALVGAGIFLITKGLGLLVPFLSPLISGLRMTLDILSEHTGVIILLTVLLAGIAVIFAALGMTVAPVLKSILEIVTSGATIIMEVMKGLGKGLSSFVTSLTTRGKTMIVALIVTICGAIMSASPEVLETVGKLIIKLFKYLGSIAGDIVEGLLEFIIQVLYGLADSISKNAPRIAAAMWGIVYALLNVVVNLVKEAVVALVEGFPGGKAISGKIDSLFDSMTQGLDKFRLERKAAAEEASNAMKDVKDLKEELDETEDAWHGSGEPNKKDGGLFSFLGDGASNASGSLGILNGEMIKTGENGMLMIPGLTGAAGAMNNLAASTDEVAKATGRSKEELEDYVLKLSQISVNAQEAMIKAGTGFRDSQGHFYEIVRKQNEEISSGGMFDISKYTNVMGSAGADGMEAFNVESLNTMGAGSMDINAMMSQYGTDSGGAFDTSQVEAMMAGQDDIYGAQVDNIDSIDQANVDNRKNVRDSMVENVNDVGVAAVNSAEPRYYKAGENSIAGIVRAIKDGKATVESAYAELAQAGVDGYNSKDGQDSHSPSKKFYKNGVFSILGIVNAINQNEDMAVGAMTTLANSMVNSFGSSLSYVGKVASGEIQYDPTIRPVLDTTRVSLGANSINSMFSRQSISLNGFSGQLAADIGQLDSRNSDVVSELQALREEMAYMTEEMTNMQMVVDSGALVGAISPGVDRSLGRMAKFRGRGN